ncbi:hypothetical protein SAMN04487964_101368 [Marinobacterium sediminicola]|uniref:Uncharacterized protein n=1 Tax=Marinobacterium sediminicola TaxID=518898 RepID=A0ABY1RWK6_9GAMM|nr:hypothetical protein SAMN04487964_101368 [Marinobacterium sediminicola]
MRIIVIKQWLVKGIGVNRGEFFSMLNFRERLLLDEKKSSENGDGKSRLKPS